MRFDGCSFFNLDQGLTEAGLALGCGCGVWLLSLEELRRSQVRKLLKVWDSRFGEINKVGYGRQKTKIRRGNLSTSAHTKTALLHEQCSGQ
ncbi:hypothetical protein J1N35_020042 [Gossypium stocksii]|uniref:Uncharacterized protein n=1 Tax=Gossypium stocksii TaxID=47602 RepID=A0A9D3VCH3_9ROSI|nr:hypothetical protein J1N35_020042 [Gossypium stocksii]